MKPLIRISLLAMVPILFFAVISLAQDKAKDAVKLSIGFTNSEYSFESLFSTEYKQGITAEADVKMAGNSKVRLGGVFQFNRASFSDSPLDTYSFGPRFSYKLGFIEPFAHALFGAQTSYNSDRVFSRTYGVGVDLNFGHVFVRPAVVDWVRTEGFNSPATQRFGAAVGVRF